MTLVPPRLMIESDKTSGNERKILLTWEYGGTGLVGIYRSSDGKNYECIASDVENFDGEYTDTTAKRGVKYTYKIRSYVHEVNEALKKVSGGETYYSDYSNVVKTK